MNENNKISNQNTFYSQKTHIKNIIYFTRLIKSKYILFNNQ